MAISFNISSIILIIVVLILLSLFIKLKNMIVKVLLIFFSGVLVVMMFPQILDFIQNLIK